MKDFRKYLQEAGYSPSTVKECIRSVEQYVASGQSPLDYLESLQSRKLKPGTLNLYLNSLEKYYDWQGGANPAKGLRVKNQGSIFTTNYFTPDELEDIYQRYSTREVVNRPIDRASQQRNMVLLGFIVYQGLSSGDLHRLEAKHINLEKGIIEVPLSLRINSRKLKLEGVQIIPIQHYIAELSKGKTNRLFPDLDNYLTLLLKQLKRLEPKLKHIRELRQSRIVVWLKQYSMREVQYRAGFKHIGSVQNYQQQDIESLQHAVAKYHPLK